MSDKWVKLANLLIQMTHDGSIDWQETTDNETYQAVIGKNAIEVEQTGFGDDFEVRVRDGSGRVVDRFTDQDLSNLSGNHYHRAFQEMFGLIARRISGTEQVLDEILSELKSRH